MTLNSVISKAFEKHEVLKVITGLNNFDLKNIITKVKAAEIGGATYLDIAANVDILKEIRMISSIPLCVSSIDIDELSNCFHAGADILEIGNFDVFYKQNICFTDDQILSLTLELRQKVPNAIISVTIPHKLSIEKQILLAKKLEELDIDMIQTEGIGSKCYSSRYLLNSIYNASAALSNTYAFAKHISIPIISSSGINPITAPIAIAYGASGVGIGSFFDSSKNWLNMAEDISSIMHSIKNHKSLNSQVHEFEFNCLNYFSSKTNNQVNIEQYNPII